MVFWASMHHIHNLSSRNVVSRLSEMPVSVSRYDHYRADYWAACSQVLPMVAIYGYWTLGIASEAWNAISFSLFSFFRISFFFFLARNHNSPSVCLTAIRTILAFASETRMESCSFSLAFTSLLGIIRIIITVQEAEWTYVRTFDLYGGRYIVSVPFRIRDMLGKKHTYVQEGLRVQKRTRVALSLAYREMSSKKRGSGACKNS